jgi:two-component system chemotaxis response regulator CheB
MTGMGNDGALGCRMLKRRGATILAQSQETCVVCGMPMYPVEEGLVDQVTPLGEIAAQIVARVGRRTAVCS